MGGFTCEFCGETLEGPASKHTLLDCAYYLKAALAEARSENENMRRALHDPGLVPRENEIGNYMHEDAPPAEEAR